MDEYIVSPNRSISTKAGIKKPGKIITEKICGNNFNKLVDLGWIIKKEDLKFKNNVIESEMQLAKPEREEIKPEVFEEKKPKKNKVKKVNFGIQKKDDDTAAMGIKTELPEIKEVINNESNSASAE